MISTTTIRERPQLLPHSLTDSHIHRLQQSTTSPWPDKLKITTVDISLLLKAKDEGTSESAESVQSFKGTSTPGTVTVAGSPIPPTQSSSPTLVDTTAVSTLPLARPPLSSLSNTTAPLPLTSTVPAKRPCRPFDQPSSESPAKKQSKWSPEEDAKIIQLRGDGMKWEDISKHLPGRSAISCRLHYQNYLERRSEWDEDRKNKLARLYERFKSDMWSRIAEEMAIPWRAAEAMHWQMGEQEMARRAGVTPFSLTTNLNQQQHSHNHPGASMQQHARPHAHIRSNSATPRMRRDSHGTGSLYTSHPPSTTSSMLIPPQLPSLAELTAGLPAYSSASNHDQLSPPILTPPHHSFNHPGANGYPFHQSRFNPTVSAHSPLPVSPAAHAHSARP